MRIAKALFGLIGTAILGLLATYIMIPEWVLVNLEQHLWQTIGGFLISAAFGGAVVFIVYATYMGWKLGSKPCKAFDDLRGIDGLGGCESLADMVEPVKQIAALRNELAASYAATEKLAAFKEDAIPKLSQLAEFEEKFDLRRFSEAQLRYMIGCLCEESVGGFGLKAHEDNPVIDSLEDAGVLRKSSEPVDADWTYAYLLTPDWRRFVARNQNEIRARIGVDSGGSPR